MFRLVAAVGIALGVTASAAAEPNAVAVPQIDVVPVEGGFEVTGRVVGIIPAEVSTMLLIEKKGRSGTVTTRQGREVSLAAGQTEIVAQSILSSDPDLILNITLEVFSNDVPVGSAHVEIGEGERN